VGIVIGVVIGLIVPNVLSTIFYYKTIELENGIPETIMVSGEEITMEYRYLPTNSTYSLNLQIANQNVTYQVNFGDTFPVFDISVHIGRISADNSTMTVQYRQVTH
jgi:hypothetical protein